MVLVFANGAFLTGHDHDEHELRGDCDTCIVANPLDDGAKDCAVEPPRLRLTPAPGRGKFETFDATPVPIATLNVRGPPQSVVLP